MNKTGKSLALFSEDELPPVSAIVPAADAVSATNLPGTDEDKTLPVTARTVQPTLEEQAAVQGVTERAQLWLALTFFAFPLEVLCRDGQPEQATVVVDEQGGRPCVVACDQLAYRQGVRTGMKLAAAYALVHELDVRARDEQQERATLARLATWAKKFTPLVSLCAPAALLLEVNGSLALFGGVAGLLKSVQHDLRMLGFAEVHAVAPTPTAALWLAKQTPSTRQAITDEHPQHVNATHSQQARRSLKSRTPAYERPQDGSAQSQQAKADRLKSHHPEEAFVPHEQGIALDEAALKAQLGRLPIAVTAWPERALLRLQGMGVRTLRDCLRLPRDGFARRVGKQHLLQLDQALGLAPDPRENYQPPDKFVARRELLFALESVNMIVRGIDKLLVELCAFLRGRQSGVQGLRITLYHPHTTASVLNVGTASACRDHNRLASLVQEKIEQLTLPEGVVAISMVSGRLYPLTGFDGQLFNDSVHSDVPWPELVEKLRARLGVEAVTGLCLVPEHRPEQSWKYTEPGTSSDTAVTHRRPVWLLAHPYRLSNRSGQPHWHGPLKVLHGPERIESGWWDGQDATRDYFVVVNPHQLTLWIYCERVAGGGGVAVSELCESEAFVFTDLANIASEQAWPDGCSDDFDRRHSQGSTDSTNSHLDHALGHTFEHSAKARVHGGLHHGHDSGGDESVADGPASGIQRCAIELPSDPALNWFVHGVFA